LRQALIGLIVEKERMIPAPALSSKNNQMVIVTT
jgi:hypothetical protein